MGTKFILTRSPKDTLQKQKNVHQRNVVNGGAYRGGEDGIGREAPGH